MRLIENQKLLAINKEEAELDLFIVPQGGPALFGRNWIDIKAVQLDGI